MQTHVVQLTKQRLSDFFVKEEGHVAHKNALVAGTVATGAILASVMLAPEAEACWRWCDAEKTHACPTAVSCCSGTDAEGDPFYYCGDPGC